MKILLLFLLSAASSLAQATYGVDVRIVNVGQQTGWVKLMQTAGYENNFTVEPGSSMLVQLRSLESGNPMIAYKSALGVAAVGASFVQDNEGNIPQLLELARFIVISDDVPPPGTPSYPENRVVFRGGDEIFSTVIWKTSDETLTANLFREGVDKIIANSSGGGSSGSGTSAEEVAVLQLSQLDSNPSVESATAAGAAKKTEAETALSTASANSRLVTGNLTVREASAASAWLITLPGFGQVDCNPLGESSVFGIVASWFRNIVSVLLLLGFEWWAWNEFAAIIRSVAMSPQARGNTVLAGTGGQATGLVAAGLLSTVLVSLPGVFWAAYDTAGTNLGAVVGDLLPSGVVFDVAGSLLAASIPLGLITILVGQYFIVQKAGLVLFTTAAVVVKFIVP